jgi:hypothetical protein
LKINLKDRHFDRIEVIEAESQTVLNTLSFQDVPYLKNDKRWERCISAEGDYFKGDDGQWAQNWFSTAC